ncbi:hypothetical protein [Endozoicomonas atrinae]|uniref:hypothetical protein n=1 Tax=Endozoicomonas atrinae TaxID=1333660 RepID=UPI000824BA1A|nr:hypothetical protein [Endozoicomonas atrinae]
MDDRLVSGDFRFSKRDIRTVDVTVVNRYRDPKRACLPIDEEQLQGIISSSKEVVDKAIEEAIFQARFAQKAERWNRQIRCLGDLPDEFLSDTHQTPEDTIRALMSNPKLVKKLVIEPDDTSDIETLLLDKVARAFRQNPQLKASTLIAQWYGTPEGELLQGIVCR